VAAKRDLDLEPDVNYQQWN